MASIDTISAVFGGSAVGGGAGSGAKGQLEGERGKERENSACLSKSRKVCATVN